MATQVGSDGSVPVLKVHNRKSRGEVQYKLNCFLFLLNSKLGLLCHIELRGLLELFTIMNHVDRGLKPSGPCEYFYPTLSCGKCVPLSCMSVLWQAGGSTGLLMDLAANEKAVHSDFFNGKSIFMYIQLTMACLCT